MKTSLPKIFFLLIALLITVAFFGLIGGFFLALFWAVVFAILFYRRFERILARMPNKPNLAAGLTTLLVVFVVIIPVSLVGLAVFLEAEELVQNITQSDVIIEVQVQDIQKKIPLDKKQLKKLGLSSKKIEKKIEKLTKDASKFISGKAVDATKNIISVLVNFFLMLYVLFFFLRDGKRIVQQFMWVMPMKDKAQMTLLKKFESVSRATVKGSLLVAFAQGALGGVLLWCLDIHPAFLFGVIMVIASLLPVGSALVWGPWVLILFYQGETTRAIILLVVGAGFIGLIDNLLRPRLVGRDTKMPDYLVLISTLGGLTWFGLSGFVLGPIIAALFVTCWQILGHEYGKPRAMVVTEPTSEELSSGPAVLTDLKDPIKPKDP